MSSGGPSSHSLKLGEAISVFSFIARSMRSRSGKNVSMSNAPSCRTGGFAMAPIRAGRSSEWPCLQ